MANLRAAIDFGTNTARLLIAERTASGIVPVRVEREIVRLGGGFTDEYGLSVDAVERGLACMKRFSEVLAEYGLSAVRASATSAVRDAVNGSAFVEQVYQETGIRLEVIDGDSEALLTLKGVLSALDHSSQKLAVLDVGGGSTEFTIAHHGKPVFVQSMPIGVVRLTEGFHGVEAMTGRVRGVLGALITDLAAAEVTCTQEYELVCTAGTATTLAAIKLAMTEYDYRLVNNIRISRDEVAEMYDRLLCLTPDERLAVAGMEKGREDLIIAGLAITSTIMDTFGFTSLIVSDFGLLEGLALSCAESIPLSEDGRVKETGRCYV
jgi:exopolyphosphatase/guanosine-5'-triphosphate,3'-diphosphate pyrophosphatase